MKQGEHHPLLKLHLSTNAFLAFTLLLCYGFLHFHAMPLVDTNELILGVPV